MLQLDRSKIMRAEKGRCEPRASIRMALGVRVFRFVRYSLYTLPLPLIFGIMARRKRGYTSGDSVFFWTSRHTNNNVAVKFDSGHFAGLPDPLHLLRVAGVSPDPPPTGQFDSIVDQMLGMARV